MAFPWIKLDDLALLPNFISDLRKDFIFFTCEMCYTREKNYLHMAYQPNGFKIENNIE